MKTEVLIVGNHRGQQKGSVGAIVLLLVGLAWSECSAAGEVIRVVPQFPWLKAGRICPSGKFAACICGRDTVGLIDLDNNCAARYVRLSWARDTAFSPDGRYLAACGGGGGFIMELTDGSIRRLNALAGRPITFSRDSRSVFITEDWSRWSGAETLRRIDLDGKVVRTYALDMSAPEVLECSPDGTSIKISGMDGNPHMRRLRMCTAEQIIELNTGRSTVEKGPVVDRYPKDRRMPVLEKIPGGTKDRVRGGGTSPLWWDEGSGICVRGRTAIDMRNGRFLRIAEVFGGHEIADVGGFIRPGILIANGCHGGRKKVLTTINIGEGTVGATNISGRRFIPSPDGVHVAASVGGSHKGSLEIWRIDGNKPLLKADNVYHDQAVRWSQDGSAVLRLGLEDEKHFVEMLRVDANEVRRFFAEQKQTIWSFAADRQLRRLAMGLGGSRNGAVMIIDPASGETLWWLKDFGGWVNALLFLDEGLLLAADIQGEVRLWDYARDKVIWSARTGGVVIQFGCVPGGKFVVCQHSMRSGTVLRASDGAIVRKSRPLLSMDSRGWKLPWSNPQLAGDGAHSLEIHRDNGEIRLYENDSGKCLLTFCPLGDGRGIVYTGEGYWDGPDDVHKDVRFYRGLNLLRAEEAGELRKRDKIDSVFASVFKKGL